MVYFWNDYNSEESSKEEKGSDLKPKHRWLFWVIIALCIGALVMFGWGGYEAIEAIKITP